MDRVALIEDSSIRPLVERFYERVRADPLLGPVFAAAVHDWSDHLARLTDFWSSVMLTTGRYKGNPIAIHLLHADQLTPERFARWLALWQQTASEQLPPAPAAAVQLRAARIAETLQHALHHRQQSAA